MLEPDSSIVFKRETTGGGRKGVRDSRRGVKMDEEEEEELLEEDIASGGCGEDSVGEVKG